MKRVFNFAAGPAVLPEPVLREVQEELLDYRGHGLSVMEMSHRSAVYGDIISDAIQRVKDILGLGDKYEVLFLQGGASTQFYMIPLNFCPQDKVANYIDTGAWSTKALKEAKKIGKKIPLLIKIDTGMGRLGIFYDEARDIIREINSMEMIEIIGLLSHFSCADMECDDFTRLQIDRFKRVIDICHDMGISLSMNTIDFLFNTYSKEWLFNRGKNEDSNEGLIARVYAALLNAATENNRTIDLIMNLP